jgi:hypothetical protein
MFLSPPDPVAHRWCKKKNFHRFTSVNVSAPRQDGKKIRHFLTRVSVDVMDAAVYVPVGSNRRIENANSTPSDEMILVEQEGGTAEF